MKQVKKLNSSIVQLGLSFSTKTIENISLLEVI